MQNTNMPTLGLCIFSLIIIKTSVLPKLTVRTTFNVLQLY